MSLGIIYPSKTYTASCTLQAPDGRIISAEYGVGVEYKTGKYLFWFRLEDFYKGLHWCKDFYIENSEENIQHTVNILIAYLTDGGYITRQENKIKADIKEMLNEIITEISLKKHKLETSNSQTCETIEKEQRSLF